MGFYINPVGETKEDWLEREADNVSRVTGYVLVDPSRAAICLVNNGPFSAALICVNQREVDAAFDPSDRRLKKWYIVDREKLYSVSTVTSEDFA